MLSHYTLILNANHAGDDERDIHGSDDVVVACHGDEDHEIKMISISMSRPSAVCSTQVLSFSQCSAATSPQAIRS
eukprot:750907-Hanusia_phi.AAC.1